MKRVHLLFVAALLVVFAVMLARPHRAPSATAPAGPHRTAVTSTVRLPLPGRVTATVARGVDVYDQSVPPHPAGIVDTYRGFPAGRYS